MQISAKHQNQQNRKKSCRGTGRDPAPWTDKNQPQNPDPQNRPMFYSHLSASSMRSKAPLLSSAAATLMNINAETSSNNMLRRAEVH